MPVLHICWREILSFFFSCSFLGCFVLSFSSHVIIGFRWRHTWPSLQNLCWFSHWTLDFFQRIKPSTPLLTGFWRLGVIFSGSILVNFQTLIYKSSPDIFCTRHTVTSVPHYFNFSSQFYLYIVFIAPIHNNSQLMVLLCVFTLVVLAKFMLHPVRAVKMYLTQYSSGTFSCSLAKFNLAAMCWTASQDIFFLGLSPERLLCNVLHTEWAVTKTQDFNW